MFLQMMLLFIKKLRKPSSDCDLLQEDSNSVYLLAILPYCPLNHEALSITNKHFPITTVNSKSLQDCISLPIYIGPNIVTLLLQKPLRFLNYLQHSLWDEVKSMVCRCVV